MLILGDVPPEILKICSENEHGRSLRMSDRSWWMASYPGHSPGSSLFLQTGNNIQLYHTYHIAYTYMKLQIYIQYFN